MVVNDTWANGFGLKRMAEPKKHLDIETEVVHVGEGQGVPSGQPTATPIYAAATYTYESMDEMDKVRALAKGRFVLQTETPNGLVLFGLRREVLEGRVPDLAEVLSGVDSVTAEDVRRVAADLIGDETLRLAVIGPFDDPERFEKLL